ncbi:MAG: hypothetical protein B7Z37_12910 [Verrucomicrobia bacterium 12-59-8]|nr:MAG: hypothetical protein B7Z37_12910 [Verrucomicrobia bacterium 12-59-8]
MPVDPNNPDSINFLSNAWEKLEKQAVDLLNIDVTTFSAPEVKLEVKGKDFNLDKLFDTMKGKFEDGSSLTLVAHTHVDFDLDAVIIAKEGASPELMAAHNKAVQTAVEGRQSFVKALKGMF